ncbi:MAG: tRNA pseudouridine(38-40) synthase TruA [Pseudomonadota bacterium]|nr:tRNA pseudouridine(38-40) synthase TruA [Pseudomonadota bacterium]
MEYYKLVLEYFGGGFVGWQRQENGMSVQEALEEAIRLFSGETVVVYVAGRTDAGVHATGQVVNFSLVKHYNADTVRDALNFHLRPHPVCVLTAEIIDHSFHARLSAIQRIYTYKIINRRAPLVLEKGYCWWVPQKLNIDKMKTAAQKLIGKHDFSTFRAAGCQAKSPVKTLEKLDIRKIGHTVEIKASARSFLYRQVRNIVGTLKLVGEEKWSDDDVYHALQAKDRRKAGPTAPAAGLYLTRVIY